VSRAALIAVLLAAAACGPSEGGRVAEGSTVMLDYELSSETGVIESSRERGEALVIEIGGGGLPARVERQLIGLSPGDEKVVDLPPELGFGERDLNALEIMPLSKFGDMAKDVRPGAKIMGARGGKAAEARVIAVEKGLATLDFNHPLAGKRLTYRLKVLKTRSR
jgi:FKBP-type peptidyl-prolyl cis-trans isomerase 2